MNRGKEPIGPLQRVLELLADVRRSGAGFVAVCPSHDDNRASLSIAEGDDGRVLLHCFAGCDITDIVAAIELEMHDLFPRTRTKSRFRGAKQHGPDA